MKKTIIFAVLGLLCFSLALAAQDVSYNFDQATDFSKFKTYKWIDENKEGAQANQLIDQQIKTAMDGELAKKGLTKTDKDDADLYVGYQVAVGQEKQLNAYNTGGAGWGYGARWGGGMTTATTTTINIGTIVFDMYNPAAKQLVWRSKASKSIDEKAKPDKRQKNLAKAAEKMLKNYPPKPKS
jgi:hypothetical protein